MACNLKHLVFISCLQFLDAVNFRCDYSYYDVGWFKYNETPMSWNDARLYCHLQGATLASPTTTWFKYIMRSKINNREIFTGIHSIYSRGQYYSLEGMPLSDMAHTWAKSEPDNKNGLERCIALNAEGEISDINCNDQRPFICYRANSNVDVNECGTLDREYQLIKRTNKCYKFHTNSEDFEQANFVCSAEGGHLAIINSEEESKVIKDIYARYPSEKINGYFWKDNAFIGFSYWEQNAEWTTIHGKSLQDAGFATFAKGESNHAPDEKSCGSVDRNGLLGISKCVFKHVFICEKPPNSPPLCNNSDPITQI